MCLKQIRNTRVKNFCAHMHAEIFYAQELSTHCTQTYTKNLFARNNVYRTFVHGISHVRARVGRHVLLVSFSHHLWQLRRRRARRRSAAQRRSQHARRRSAAQRRSQHARRHVRQQRRRRADAVPPSVKKAVNAKTSPSGGFCVIVFAHSLYAWGTQSPFFTQSICRLFAGGGTSGLCCGRSRATD